MGLLRYRISPEGYFYIFLALLIGGVTYQLTRQPLILFMDGVVIFVLMYVFRDSTRTIPSLPLGVISPIDGEVEHVVRILFEQYGTEAQQIKIRGNVFGSYILRGPTEGKVCKYWIEGRRQYFSIQTDEGDNVAIGLDTGWFGNRPRINTAVGERVGQGRRFGSVPVAGDVYVVVDGAAKIDIQVGDRVRSGESVVATIRH